MCATRCWCSPTSSRRSSAQRRCSGRTGTPGSRPASHRTRPTRACSSRVSSARAATCRFRPTAGTRAAGFTATARSGRAVPPGCRRRTERRCPGRHRCRARAQWPGYRRRPAQDQAARRRRRPPQARPAPPPIAHRQPGLASPARANWPRRARPDPADLATAHTPVRVARRARRRGENLSRLAGRVSELRHLYDRGSAMLTAVVTRRTTITTPQGFRQLRIVVVSDQAGDLLDRLVGRGQVAGRACQAEPGQIAHRRLPHHFAEPASEGGP
jgi:hypothetical protein